MADEGRAAEASPSVFPKPNPALRTLLLNRLRYIPGRSDVSQEQRRQSESDVLSASMATSAAASRTPHAPSAAPPSRRATHSNPSSDASSAAPSRARPVRNLSQVNHSHGDMAELMRIRGWRDIADNLLAHQLEFCYLRRDTNNPYQLSVCSVPKTFTKADYITLSLHGIVRYATDGETEHRTFAEFIREHDSYNAVKSLRTFGKFRTWKYLYMWRVNVVHKKRSKIRNELSVLICCIEPSLYQLALTINTRCYRLSSISVIDIKSSKPYFLADLIEELQSYLTRQSALVQQAVEDLRAFVCTECEKQHMAFLMNLPTMQAALKASKSKCIDSDYKFIAKSINTQPLSYTERAIMRTHCRNATKRIRVLDLQLRDALYSVVDTSFERFLRYIFQVRSDSTSVCMLIVTSHFDTASLKLSVTPTRVEVADGMKTQLKSTFAVGYTIHSLLKHAAMEHVLIPIAAEIKDIVSETMLDRVYGDPGNSLFRMLYEVMDVFLNDFDAALELLNSYSTLCIRIAAYDAVIAKLTLDAMGLMNKSTIEKIFVTLNCDISGAEDMPLSIKAGVYELDMKPVKNVLTLQLSVAKTHIHSTIQTLYLKLGENLYSTLFGFKSIFDETVITLDEFVKVLVRFNYATEIHEQLRDQYDYLLAVRSIIVNYGVESTLAITELSDTAPSIWFQYNKCVTQFTDSLEGNRKFFMRELSLRAQILAPLMTDCSNRIKSTILNDPVADEYECLSEIDKASTIITNIFQACEKLVGYQNIMMVSVFDYRAILDLSEEIKSIQSIWRVHGEVKVTEDVFLRTRLFALDTADVTSKCNAYLRTLRLLSRPHVIPVMKSFVQSSISAILHKLPLCSLLLAPTLQSRHWDDIHGIAGFKIHKQVSLTVETLINTVSLTEQVESIRSVLQVSRFEQNMSERLLSLVARCEGLNLLSDESKGLVSISNFSAVVEELQDVQVEIKFCITSIYAAPCLGEYEKLELNVFGWQDTLLSLKVLQEAFLTIRALFTSPRANRYLHKTLKYFKVIDDFWRSIYLLCRESNAVEIFKNKDIIEGIVEVETNLVVLHTRIDEFLQQMCEECPQFLFLDKVSLLEIFSIVNIDTIYKKFKDVLLPFSSSFINHMIERDKTVGIMSGAERILFLSSVSISSKDDLILWIRGIYEGLRNRLIHDCKQFISGKALISTDLRSPQCCEQSRNFALNVKFWADVAMLNNAFIPDRKLIMKLRLKQTSSITSYVDISRSFTSAQAYQRICVANLLSILIYQRDVLYALSTGKTDYDAVFLLESSLKVAWEKDGEKGIVLQSHVKFDYGNMYHGFGTRLCITPLTQRVFFAISISTQRNQIAVLKASSPTYTAGIAEEYAGYVGYDCRSINSEYVQSVASIDRILYYGLKSKTFLIISKAERFTEKYAAVLIDRLSAITTAVQTKTNLSLNGQNIEWQTISCKMCLLVTSPLPFDTSAFATEDWTAKEGDMFRPVYVSPVQSRVLYSVTLQAYGFPQHNDLSIRLESLQEYLTLALKSVRLSSVPVTKIAVECIRAVGLQRDADSSYGQSALSLLRELLTRLGFDQYVQREHLLVTCCVYLGINNPFEAIIDEKRLETVERLSTVDHLVQLIQSNASVVVAGYVMSGKTSAVMSAYAALSVHPSADASFVTIHSINLTEVLSKERIETRAAADNNRSKAYSSSMQLGCEEYIASLVNSLPESVSVMHLLHIDTAYVRYIPQLIRWCWIMFSQKRSDVKFIWEMLDVKNFEPSLITHSRVLTIDTPELNMEAILTYHTQVVAQSIKDRIQHLSAEDILTSVRAAVQGLLAPCLLALKQLTDLRSYSYTTSLVQNTLKLARELLTKSNILLLYTSELFSMDFQRCLLFAITWVLGGSDGSRDSFIVMYQSVFQDLVKELPSIFQPTWQIFNYILVNSTPEESEEGEYRWSNALHAPETHRHTHLCSEFAELSTIFIPTSFSLALESIQSAMHDDGQIVLHGSAGCGKSALLRHLLQSKIHDNRFLCYAQNNNSVRIRENILLAQRKIKLKVLESNSSICGSVFIEDVSFDMQTEANISSTCADFLRFLFRSKSIYNLDSGRLEHFDELLTVMSCRELPSCAADRLARFCICLQVITDTRYVMTGILRDSMTCIDESIGIDLATFTSALLSECLKRIPHLTDSITPLGHFSYVISKISKVLSIYENLSSAEGLSLFINHFFDFNSSELSSKIKDIATHLLRSKTIRYEDTNFIDFTLQSFTKSSMQSAISDLSDLTAASLVRSTESFQDDCSTNLSFYQCIPMYIDKSSSQFWSDLQRLLLSVLTNSNSVLFFSSNNAFLLHDMSVLVARYCNYSHCFLLLDYTDKFIESIIDKLYNAFILFGESTEAITPVSMWYCFVIFTSTQEDWKRFIDIANFRSAKMEDIFSSRLGRSVREDAVLSAQYKSFALNQHFVFALEKFDKFNDTILSIRKLDTQAEVTSFSLPTNIEYDLDMTTFNSIVSLSIIDQVFGVINTIIKNSTKYLEAQSSYDMFLWTDGYKHDSFRLILQLYRLIQKNLVNTRLSINAEYKAHGIAIPDGNFELTFEQYALTDSIFLVMYTRYFLYLSSEVLKYEVPRLHSGLEALDLPTYAEFDIACVLKGILQSSDEPRKSVSTALKVISFLPNQSALRKRMCCCALSLLLGMTVVLVDSTGFTGALISEILSAKMESLYDSTLLENIVVIFDRDSLEDDSFARTSRRFLLPTCELYDTVSVEALAVFFLVHGMETNNEISTCWKDHSGFSPSSFLFTWNRYIRSLDKPYAMLSATASSAIQAAPHLQGTFQRIIVSQLLDKSLTLADSISALFVYIKAVFSKDELLMFAIYIALKLSVVTDDPLLFINTLVFHMRVVNGSGGYDTASSSKKLTNESHDILKYLELELYFDADDSAITCALETEDSESAVWLLSLSDSCENAPFVLKSRALGWIEIFAVTFLLKPSSLRRTILDIVDDKGYGIGQFEVCETFSRSVLSKLSLLCCKYEGRFNSGPNATLACIAFHLLLYHSVVSLYVTSSCAANTILDNCLETVLQLLSLNFSRNSESLIRLLQQYVVGSVYCMSTPNFISRDLFLSCFEMMMNSMKFEANTWDLRESCLGYMSASLTSANAFTVLTELATSALNNGELFKYLNLTTYDMNLLGRHEVNLALQVVPLTVVNPNPDVIDLKQVERKLSELISRLNLPFEQPNILLITLVIDLSQKRIKEAADDFDEREKLPEPVALIKRVKLYVEIEISYFNSRLAEFIRYLQNLQSHVVQGNIETVISDIRHLCSNFISKSAPMLNNISHALHKDLETDVVCSEAKKKHDAFKTWLSSGRPGVLSLKFLESPKRLLLSMKEDLATNSGAPLDSICCEYSLFTKMTTSVLKSMREDKDTRCVYFYGIRVVNAYYNDTTDCLEPLPEFSNCILNSQKLFLKISLKILDKGKEDIIVGLKCPVYVADEVPQDYSVLSEYFAIEPTIDINVRISPKLLATKGRGVAFFSVMSNEKEAPQAVAPRPKLLRGLASTRLMKE